MFAILFNVYKYSILHSFRQYLGFRMQPFDCDWDAFCFSYAVHICIHASRICKISQFYSSIFANSYTLHNCMDTDSRIKWIKIETVYFHPQNRWYRTSSSELSSKTISAMKDFWVKLTILFQVYGTSIAWRRDYEWTIWTKSSIMIFKSYCYRVW